MARQRSLDRMAVARLGDVAIAIVNRAIVGRLQDSTGQPLVQVRAALVAELQEALAAVWVEGDRSLSLNRALERVIVQPEPPARARTVFAVTLEDACGRRRVVGVRAKSNRIAWDAAETFYGDRAVALKAEDRGVDLEVPL